MSMDINKPIKIVKKNYKHMATTVSDSEKALALHEIIKPAIKILKQSKML